MMRDAKKRIMVVFKDGQERLLHVPLESEIQVCPCGVFFFYFFFFFSWKMARRRK